MRVLIAGGVGFIGTQVVKRFLKSPNVEVAVLCREKPEAHVANYYVDCNWEVAYMDERVLGFDPDVVVNLIGGSHPRGSVGDYCNEVEVNVIPFLKLIDALSRKNLKRVVFSSSAGAIYESGLIHEVKKFPDTPYCATKISIESYLSSICINSNLEAISLRISNPVGIGCNKSGFGVVNVFSRLIATDEPVKFFGDADMIKDYIALDDVVEGVVRSADLINNISGYCVMDLGSGVSLSAREIFEVLQDFNARGYVGDYKYHDSQLDMGVTDLILGWSPSRSVFKSMYDVFLNERGSAL